MKRFVRVLAPIVWILGLAACGASQAAPAGVTQMQAPAACKVGGEHCRWDGQCCSGRCYVDTGCSS